MQTRISIFTPTHAGSKYLLDTYNSIKDQSFDEWVIVLNNGGYIDPSILKDKRVRLYDLPFAPESVGAMKNFACSKCSYDVFLELDHDDLLTEHAIERVKEAFNNSDVGFVYSNSANFRGDFVATELYGEEFGWKYKTYIHNGHVLYEAKAFKEYPSGLSKIWFCPNHLRAWSREAYYRAGGHPKDKKILDDQDLISRTYRVTTFKHIDECLYLYRVTGDNTWIRFNKEIQEQVGPLHEKHVEEIAEKWADNNKLLKIDMGAVHNHKEGYKSCDIYGDVDFEFDATKKWPFEDSSVGVVRAFDFLEHIPNKVHVINEIYRVLAHGGMLLSQTPSTDGRGAFQDPTHCAYYNEHSFWYYTDQNFQKYVPEITARFQVDTLYTFTPRPNIPYVKAYLTAIKGSDLPDRYGWDRNSWTK